MCIAVVCVLLATHSDVKNTGGALYAVRALCMRCAKSRLFSTTGSHGSQGPEFCTVHPLQVHQGYFFLV